MPTSLKVRFKVGIGKKIPQRLLNNTLLLFPFLYKTKFFNYEAYQAKKSIRDLIDGLNMTKNLPGDIIECGCARCGTTAILAKYLKTNQIRKKYYALDSFEGFRLEELQREKDKGLTEASKKAFTYNSYEYALKKIKKLGLSERVVLVKGYFQETLPNIDSRFCMGFIDCDLSESVRYAAETIWPRLVNGGILLFDEYGFENFRGVTNVVDKFVRDHSQQIESHGQSRLLYLVKKTI